MKENKLHLEERIKKRVLWKDVAKEEYFERRREIESADNKLLYLLLFVFTILSLFIQFISLPKEIYGVIFYLITSLLYLISILILLYGIFPKRGNSINFDENENNDYEDEIRTLKNQYAIAFNRNDKVINRKLYSLIVSTIIFIFALIFTFIINLIQSP